MPPEVSRFQEANLLPRGVRQIQNSKEKVRDYTTNNWKSQRPDDQSAIRQSRLLTILSPWSPQNIWRNLHRRSIVALPCPTTMDAAPGPFRSMPSERGLFPSEAHTVEGVAEHARAPRPALGPGRPRPRLTAGRVVRDAAQAPHGRRDRGAGDVDDRDTSSADEEEEVVPGMRGISPVGPATPLFSEFAATGDFKGDRHLLRPGGGHSVERGRPAGRR